MSRSRNYTASDPQAVPAGHGTGLAAALGAFTIWGFLPLYFRLIGSQAGVWEVVAHRILWATVALGLFMLATRRTDRLLYVFRNRRMLLALAASALCIVTNWLTFIWAVTHNHVLESSLGYYITPILNVLMGVAFLRERLRVLQLFAIVIAAIGVLIMIIAYGRVPWVALTLAVAFGSYGLIRKKVEVDSATGLQVETLLLTPVALMLLAWLNFHHEMRFLHSSSSLNALLVGAGVVTIIPLVLFAAGARRLNLATIGVLQYITPTLQFFTGVFLFGEPFTRSESITFACIWISLALYTLDTLLTQRRVNRIKLKLEPPETNHAQ